MLDHGGFVGVWDVIRAAVAVLFVVVGVFEGRRVGRLIVLRGRLVLLLIIGIPVRWIVNHVVVVVHDATGCNVIELLLLRDTTTW